MTDFDIILICLSFTDGWCADSNQNGQKWLEIDLGVSGMGISGVIVAPYTSNPQNFPQDVLVQYVPVGGHTPVDFPFPDGKLVSWNNNNFARTSNGFFYFQKIKRATSSENVSSNMQISASASKQLLLIGTTDLRLQLLHHENMPI